MMNVTLTKWNDKYENGDVVKSGIFSKLGDTGGGIVALIMSLEFCLYI